jgi:hypothetical protein
VLGRESTEPASSSPRQDSNQTDARPVRKGLEWTDVWLSVETGQQREEEPFHESQTLK